jgi:hypothetical protein
MNYKEEITKLIMASYDQGVKDAQQEALVALEKMVALVRADEREACAKACEDGVQNANDWDSSYWDQACENRAAAIRARGQA